MTAPPACCYDQSMTADLLFALIGFAFVTSASPGPNNLMLLSSGVNFGVRRTIPHMLGVGLGFGFMIMVIGLGLGQLFTAYPVLHTVLKAVGVTYMLWLAWKIANAGPVGEGRGNGRPMTFLQAAAFQWVNPKAWAMGLGAIAAYTLPQNYLLSVLLVAITFTLVNIPSVSAWVLFGSVLKTWLANPRVLRAFNIVMALLLVASMIPVVLM